MIPTHDEAGNPLLPDHIYLQLMELDPSALVALPPDLQQRFENTRRWLSEEKFTMRSIGGITVGGRTLDEISKNPTPAAPAGQERWLPSHDYPESLDKLDKLAAEGIVPGKPPPRPD